MPLFLEKNLTLLFPKVKHLDMLTAMYWLNALYVYKMSKHVHNTTFIYKYNCYNQDATASGDFQISSMNFTITLHATIGSGHWVLWSKCSP